MSIQRGRKRDSLSDSILAIFVLTLMPLLVGGPAAARMDLPAACAQAPISEAGEYFESEGAGAGLASCVELRIPSAGVTLVSADPSARAARGVRLGLAGVCDRLPQPEIARLPGGELVLRSEGARRVLLCTASRSVLEPLGPFALHASHAPEVPFRTPEPIEVDPDPRTPEPIEVDPDPKASFSISSRQWVALCTPEAGDDHGHAASCATALRMGVGMGSVEVVGTLARHDGVDRDAFAIVLGREGTLRVEGLAEVAVLAELRDARGNLLAQGSKSEEGFRLASWLPPGRYILSLLGSGGEGGYALEAEVEEASW